MDVIRSPFYWYIRAQVWNKPISNDEIKQAIVNSLEKNFSESEVEDKIDILDRLFYPWYTEQYKHTIDISDDELDKLSDISFSENGKIKINETVSVYSSTLNLIIESAVSTKKWKNRDDVRLNRR
jgi:hypothetical protein